MKKMNKKNIDDFLRMIFLYWAVYWMFSFTILLFREGVAGEKWFSRVFLMTACLGVYAILHKFKGEVK
jgi:hypothetical protein